MANCVSSVLNNLAGLLGEVNMLITKITYKITQFLK